MTYSHKQKKKEDAQEKKREKTEFTWNRGVNTDNFN